MSRVEVWRGSLIESVHRVSIAVVDAGGRLRASSGDPHLVAFARSAVKPIQAMPLIEDDVAATFALNGRELALCCASHSGEERHTTLVRRMLARIGVEESVLACGPHAPFDQPTARALLVQGLEPGRIHNNCSGKHAGMIALACAHGWPVSGYEKPEHPVQQRMLEEMARWTGVPADDMATAVDGCGVVTFALSLERMAAAFARIAAAARAGHNAPARIVEAMAKYPEYVAGSGRMCTALIRTADGRIIAKTGAEGVYCALVPGAELGIALKVEDGATRASEPAMIAVLRVLGLVSDDEVAELTAFAEPVIRNTRGEAVGRISALVRLDTHE